MFATLFRPCGLLAPKYLNYLVFRIFTVSVPDEKKSQKRVMCTKLDIFDFIIFYEKKILCEDKREVSDRDLCINYA